MTLVAPEKPVVHWQVNPATPSTHAPPLLQGLAAQSSMFVSQCRPLKPGLHAQVYAPG